MINSDLLSPFGQLLRSARLSKDLTLEQAAQALGIKRRRLQEYELGYIRSRPFPNAHRCRVIAKLYGLDLERIFEKIDESRRKE